jgi:hypothetical protein
MRRGLALVFLLALGLGLASADTGDWEDATINHSGPPTGYVGSWSSSGYQVRMPGSVSPIGTGFARAMTDPVAVLEDTQAASCSSNHNMSVYVAAGAPSGYQGSVRYYLYVGSVLVAEDSGTITSGNGTWKLIYNAFKSCGAGAHFNGGVTVEVVFASTSTSAAAGLQVGEILFCWRDSRPADAGGSGICGSAETVTRMVHTGWNVGTVAAGIVGAPPGGACGVTCMANQGTQIIAGFGNELLAVVNKLDDILDVLTGLATDILDGIGDLFDPTDGWEAFSGDMATLRASFETKPPGCYIDLIGDMFDTGIIEYDTLGDANFEFEFPFLGATFPVSVSIWTLGQVMQPLSKLMASMLVLLWGWSLYRRLFGGG